MGSLSLFLGDCGFRERVQKINDDTALLLFNVESEEVAYALELTKDVYGDRLKMKY